MTQKLANKPNSSRKHKARRAHSRRNLQARLPHPPAEGRRRSARRLAARGARLTRLVRGPAGARRSISGHRREAARERDGTRSYRGAQSMRLAVVHTALLPSIERSAQSLDWYLNETFTRAR